MDKKSSEYRLIRMADTSFLFCIIFEVVGIMTVMFFGTLGAQMAIYFMTMLFAVFMARSRKAEFRIPFERPKVKTLLQSVGISVCGIPIALVLLALAAFLSSVLGWCGQLGGYNKISDLACHDSICYRAGGCGGVCIPWVDTWGIYECRYESCCCD